MCIGSLCPLAVAKFVRFLPLDLEKKAGRCQKYVSYHYYRLFELVLCNSVFV